MSVMSLWVKSHAIKMLMDQFEYDCSLDSYFEDEPHLEKIKNVIFKAAYDMLTEVKNKIYEEAIVALEVLEGPSDEHSYERLPRGAQAEASDTAMQGCDKVYGDAGWEGEDRF